MGNNNIPLREICFSGRGWEFFIEFVPLTLLYFRLIAWWVGEVSLLFRKKKPIGICKHDRSVPEKKKKCVQKKLPGLREKKNKKTNFGKNNGGATCQNRFLGGKDASVCGYYCCFFSFPSILLFVFLFHKEKHRRETERETITSSSAKPFLLEKLPAHCSWLVLCVGFLWSRTLKVPSHKTRVKKKNWGREAGESGSF